MTPKEKAKELVDKYFKLLNYEFGDLVYSLSDKQPHQCALIVVDEIIAQIEPSVSMDVISARIKYWEEVKQEIEKL
jgi:hypothetical protein